MTDSHSIIKPSVPVEPTERPLRYCDVCAQLDDHPRHVIHVGPDHPSFSKTNPGNELIDRLQRPEGASNAQVARAITEINRPGLLLRHLDCCAAQGCEVCKATEKRTGGVRGQELLAALQDGATNDIDTTAMKVGGI